MISFLKKISDVESKIAHVMDESKLIEFKKALGNLAVKKSDSDPKDLTKGKSKA